MFSLDFTSCVGIERAVRGVRWRSPGGFDGRSIEDGAIDGEDSVWDGPGDGDGRGGEDEALNFGKREGGGKEGRGDCDGLRNNLIWVRRKRCYADGMDYAGYV